MAGRGVHPPHPLAAAPAEAGVAIGCATRAAPTSIDANSMRAFTGTSLDGRGTSSERPHGYTPRPDAENLGAPRTRRRPWYNRGDGIRPTPRFHARSVPPRPGG